MPQKPTALKGLQENGGTENVDVPGVTNKQLGIIKEVQNNCMYRAGFIVLLAALLCHH